MSDTTTSDNSHKNCLAVCLRYVDDNGKAIERHLEIAERIDKTGPGTDNLVFQSYDYASNMSDQFNRTQSKLSEVVGHHIFYIPCQAHEI